ncbi:MAG TPA: hypothetical protein VFY29_14450 [Terriglobia bacterium]|nr:hypothetical protein [Terriglobia bacterium]
MPFYERVGVKIVQCRGRLKTRLYADAGTRLAGWSVAARAGINYDGQDFPAASRLALSAFLAFFLTWSFDWSSGLFLKARHGGLRVIRLMSASLNSAR